MTASKKTGGIRLAADIGGTFTDLAAFDPTSGKLLFGKTLSTPDKLINGIADGVSKAGTSFPDAELFLHGSTIAINTIAINTITINSSSLSLISR